MPSIHIKTKGNQSNKPMLKALSSLFLTFIAAFKLYHVKRNRFQLAKAIEHPKGIGVEKFILSPWKNKILSWFWPREALAIPF
jgi:hypothetical protein